MWVRPFLSIVEPCCLEMAADLADPPGRKTVAAFRHVSSAYSAVDKAKKKRWKA